jgi:hypothetical protein
VASAPWMDTPGAGNLKREKPGEGQRRGYGDVC